MFFDFLAQGMHGMPHMEDHEGEDEHYEDEDEEIDHEHDQDHPNQPQEVDNKTLYEVLDLEPQAPISKIKKAFHKKAMVMHPDKGGDPESF